MVFHRLRSLMIPLTLMTAVTGVVNPAHAVIFDFDITFDGTNPSIDATSDTIVGTSFNLGDGFNLDIHADGNDFWQVDANINSLFEASFLVLPIGTRTGDVTTTFFLDGVQTGQIVETSVDQSFVHIGNQVFNVSAGLTFDQAIVDYILLASTAPTTSIEPASDILSFGPFFRNPNISYVQGPATVPEPTALALLGFGLVAIGISHQRRRQRTA